ncbi:NepR family anti-sigma factor [uncultured Cohaesibacter sp.]|uniref:NepR family anti-sigma factor n=1 Tax=uncultured Cohaesibacter sp. TaxID=1002546 RepID=UPI0029C95948|nr:NepR family anti-sigma factor [uncultured Cohaesibacter sp.]
MAGLSASDMLGQQLRTGADWDPNDAISQKLKALYTHTEQEAIPDRFLDLLEQLDEAERVAKHGNEG